MNSFPSFSRLPSIPDLHDDVLPPPPLMPAATATSDVLAPPRPPPSPKLSWQFIWSFFVRAPRVRAWLFDKSPPPLTHVAQALLSSPVLCGYVFGRVERGTPQHCFPDIGDMNTTFCRDGDTLLGFHFGFSGVQPILPMLFSVARDPMLGNPRVVVRRTAIERVHLPDMPPCYVAIEFSWLESGALSVVTNVHPVDADPAKPTGMAPFFDHAEYRVFDRAAAHRLKTVATRLDDAFVHGYFPSPDHFRQPPADFLDPPEDYISLNIEEPNDPIYHSCLSPANLRLNGESRRGDDSGDGGGGGGGGYGGEVGTGFGVGGGGGANADDLSPNSSTSQQIPLDDSSNEPVFNAIAGAALHADCGESPSIAEEGTIVRWKAFQDVVAVARRTGMLKTSVGRKVGGLFAKVETLYSRTAGYTFLSTAGVSVHGRIQRLCEQLGIQVSSPAVDAPLSRSAGGGSPVLIEAIAADGAPRSPPTEVDITAKPIDKAPWLGGVSGAGQPVSLLTKQEPRPEKLSQDHGARRFAHSVSTARDQAVPPSLLEVRPRSDSANGGLGGAGEEAPRAKRPRVETAPATEAGGSQSGSRSGSGNSSSSSGGVADGVSTATHSTQAGPASLRIRSEGTVIGKGNKAVWTCEQCGVKIRGKKGNLNRHIANKHDNIRAYLCKFPACGRRFQTRLNLVRHERAVHEGRPFVCPHCPRAFKVQNDLNAHVASAHSESGVKLACDVCGSCFARRSTLNRHKIRVHKISP